MQTHIKEFQCIMPIENMGSILTNGILSYYLAAKLKHNSVAMPEIQDLRDKKSVPGGLKLHQYANLYFHARNPMMYKRKEQAELLCVLRVNTDVSKLPGVVFSDGNAASDYSRFLAPAQWELLNLEDIYAKDWRHADSITFYKRKSRKCAEILVPNKVEINYLFGAYVVNEAAKKRLLEMHFPFPITIDPQLFFN